MIEILISLCLVFALFSGLVSGINELIAQTLEMRGKVLYESIALLLGDSTKLKSRIMRWAGWVDIAEDSVTVRLFAHPLVDTLSQPGSKPSYIAPSIFASALVQVLSIDGSWPALRQALDDRSSALGKLFGPMLDQADGDIDKFTSQVESHFIRVMDRVSGWYKRRSQTVMFFVALVLAVALNVDTLYITQRLQTDPVLVAELVKTAEAFKETAVGKADTEMAAKLDGLQGQIANFQKMGLPIGWDLPKQSAPKCIWHRVPGWLFTALAATLGAPFWFDAISKFFSIRGAGRKPEDSTVVANANALTPVIQLTMPAALPPAQVENSPINDYEASRLNGEDIEGLQRALGLPVAQINGRFSPELRTALRGWQLGTGRDVNGRFDESTVTAILYPEG